MRWPRTGSSFSFFSPPLAAFMGNRGSCCSVTQLWQLFVTPYTAAHQASLSSLPPGVCSDSCPLSRRCHSPISFSPLLLLPSTFPSIRIFSNELVLRLRWPKYWSFSFRPSRDYSGLTSFRMDWIDLLAVPGTQQRQISHQFTKQTFKEKFALCLGKEQTPREMQACLLSEYTS